jgi:hypothetical protein
LRKEGDGEGMLEAVMGFCNNRGIRATTFTVLNINICNNLYSLILEYHLNYFC